MISAPRIGVLEQVLGNLAGAAADVEDRLSCRARSNCRVRNSRSPSGNVQRQHAARGQHRALRPAVDVLHLGLILVELTRRIMSSSNEPIERGQRRRLRTRTATLAGRFTSLPRCAEDSNSMVN